ncbi:MAG: S-methyl-5-thioribose-1-phosphate isomerase [Desulfonatronovibrio sp.]
MEHIYFSTEKNKLILLDQRLLPLTEEWFECADTGDVVYALQEMVVRGAPAIGVTAAYGCVLAALEVHSLDNWKEALQERTRQIAEARPTAANLVWAVKTMLARMQGQDFSSARELAGFWLKQAIEIHSEDVRTNKTMGSHGSDLLADGDTVMTHCNAGALATGGYGTALGVVRAAVELGRKIKVIANETRPFLQGARLTAYELARDGIEVKVACDNACAHLMRKGLVDKVIVGADRIAANGDTANKIGTYAVAIAAARHGIPFYVAAPFSTFDLNVSSGDLIPIEDRTPDEVKYINDVSIIPEDVEVYNHAFDITPAELIAGIITEKGVLRKPFEQSIASAAKNKHNLL